MEKYLPWTRKTVNGVKILLQLYKEKSFSDVLSLFQRSVQDSTGVGESEFQNADDLKKYLAKSNLTVTYHDEGRNNKMIGCLMIYGTPLSRSSVPLYAGGYSVMDKHYRGKGLYNRVIFDVYEHNLVRAGCPGSLARNALSAVTAIANLKAGATMIGVIPKAINIPKLGWLVDLIPYSHFPAFTEEHFIQVFSFAFSNTFCT